MTETIFEKQVNEVRGRQRSILLAVVWLLIIRCGIGAAELELRPLLVEPDSNGAAICIDGTLNEEVWTRHSPMSKNFVTYSPVYGKKVDQTTDIWMAYSGEYLYFAFRCHDDQPDKIKTSICQRDKMFADDWVAVLLDAMGNKQTSYEFYVNPNGIQGDNLNSSVAGTGLAPDFVWQSAARLTDQGYDVEIAIPLESIRFKSGDNVRMGVLFLRNINRLGVSATWPETQPGQTDFHFMAPVIYHHLQMPLKLEILPNFTYSSNKERLDNDLWSDSDISKNAGVFLKYGLTSSITAEATLYPDFSQVESDAFQLEVNRRYPVFYIEKRPFFMEGMEVFDFGVVRDGMMVEAVHTRQMMDPSWAGKVSGTAGRFNFALLAANDRIHDGDDALWSVARGKYSLGGDNSVGFIYSGRYTDGSDASAAGLDLQYRPFENARFSASYLYTGRQGHGANAMLQYLTPRITAWATLEHYDQEFNMPSAFMNRGALTRAAAYIGPNIYLKSRALPWLLRVEPHAHASFVHDLETNMDDRYWTLGVDLYMTGQSFLKLEYKDEREAWMGEIFNQRYLYAFAGVRPANWLSLSVGFRAGDQIYYGPGQPFLGDGRQLMAALTLQPGLNFNLDVQYLRHDLFLQDGQRFYGFDIVNVETTYQFNKYFFIRAAARYDGYYEKILSDFLASITVIPGTVVHLGYGSLYQNGRFWEGKWQALGGRYENLRNGLFFKVSYLWRIK